MIETKKKTSGKAAAKQHKTTQLSVFDIKGKEVGKIKLDEAVFDAKVSQALIHQAVVTYLANRRKGTACTKTRGEVSGGGAKPWRQKGTGRARVGSTRSPLWRKGGVTFGPKPRNYRKDLPKKMRVLALKSALNVKLAQEQIMVLDDIKVSSHKTKEMCKIINNLKLSGEKVRFVASQSGNDFKLACRNIKDISLAKPQELHTVEIMNCKKLVLTKEALKAVEERIKKCLQ